MDNSDQHEIELLRDMLKQRNKQLEAYRAQVKYLNQRIGYFKSCIETYKEAQEKLSELGENPMDYFSTEAREFDGQTI